MEPKLVFAIISTLLGLAGFGPYFWDIFHKKTTPHIYTWLIWCLTQGTATLGLLKGGGGFGAIALSVGTFFVFLIFLLCFRYGTKNITRNDTIVLTAALIAVVMYWFLHLPLIAVLMVSAIDGAGYIPTWRKTFEEPWSETLWTWGIFSIANIFALFALKQFNLLTATYLITITAANIIVLLIGYTRRNKANRPIADN
ncbi:MAG TPA: hypothetical protein VLE93_01605 [Candidatus Saccharimonadales bacterium]|nr:hypothetical protein [Candidatus Saccharimonadales bacterium]